MIPEFTRIDDIILQIEKVTDIAINHGCSYDNNHGTVIKFYMHADNCHHTPSKIFVTHDWKADDKKIETYHQQHKEEAEEWVKKFLQPIFKF